MLAEYLPFIATGVIIVGLIALLIHTIRQPEPQPKYWRVYMAILTKIDGEERLLLIHTKYHPSHDQAVKVAEGLVANNNVLAYRIQQSVNGRWWTDTETVKYLEPQHKDLIWQYSDGTTKSVSEPEQAEV